MTTVIARKMISINQDSCAILSAAGPRGYSVDCDRWHPESSNNDATVHTSFMASPSASTGLGE